MPDFVIQTVVDTLIQDVTIGTRTQGRVNGVNIVNVPQPEYPMITIERWTPGYVDPFAPVSTFSIMLTCFSNNSYDEAFDLLDRAKTLVNRQRFTGTQSFVLHADGGVAQDSDSSAETVYWCKIPFEVHMVGE